METSDRLTIADLSQVRKIAHPTLSQRVYHDLRELLLAGQVLPGQRLTLKGLADALGTSAMPIREALRQLAAEGALEILPNKSVRVPLMTQARFRELLQIRLQLEGLAVEQAVTAITATELAQVEELHEQLCIEMRRQLPNTALIVQLNKQLHFAVYASCRMPVLLSMIESLWLQVGPIVNLDLRNGSRRLSEAPALAHHARMLAGIQQGSAAEARAGLSGDLLSAADMILAEGGLPT